MDNLFTLPVMFVILSQILPSSPVTVSTSIPVVEVHEDQVARLSCEFSTENDEKPRIEWKKTRGTMSTSPDFVYFEGEFRRNFRGRATIKGATVTLEKVTQEDAGEYRCEVSAASDSVQLGEANITLIVLVPPQVPSCEIPSSAITGTEVEMLCSEPHGVPAVFYIWYKDKKPLPVHPLNGTYSINQNTGTLTFKSVTKADTGQYHCEARNKAGPPKSCEGTHMEIDDLNISAIIAGVVVVCLVIALCTFGACYAHRHGLFSRDIFRNTTYSPPPEEKQQDFKHTHSFML
ncbi:hypothetical protein ACEWY4_016645 [Coilia grayii]|uniref:Ig-like domain-containing protein n=1 Tax=Coilia grayii TaxID=363190 RepID=A0ABD1JL26_9TELE